jgi:hypothetical protein
MYMPPPAFIQQRQSYWDISFDFIGTNVYNKTRTTLLEQQNGGEGILFLEGSVLAHLSAVSGRHSRKNTTILVDGAELRLY